MKKNSLTFLFLKLFSSLERERKKSLIFGFLLIILNGISEIILLASFVIFLETIDGKLVSNNKFINSIGEFFDLNQNQLNLIVLFTFLTIIIISSSLRVITIRKNIYLAAEIGNDIGFNVLKNTLSREYIEFSKDDSSRVISLATTETAFTVASIKFFLYLISSLFIAICIVISLIIINPLMTLTITISLLLAYLLIATTIRKTLSKNSHNLAKSSKVQVKLLQNILGAIRDIKLDDNEDFYLSNYYTLDQKIRRMQAKSQFLSSFPKYVIEGIGMFSIILIAIILTLNNSNSEILPRLGVLALGAQRLLPSLQQTYASWTIIKSYKKSNKDIIDIIDKPKVIQKHNLKNIQFDFDNKIQIRDISFLYEDSKSYTLKNFNLEIKKTHNIGITGASGSGKSTFLDILMGLIKPTDGSIFVDNHNIYQNQELLILWKRIISHVPQRIFLTNDTILSNIAFGKEIHEIDFDKLYECCKVANILKFIENLPEGFNTYVGERGVRVSGGQIQRIGIARALYKEPEIIFLDEATSALDYKNEEKVISNITNFAKDITLITVSHRIKTLKNCDHIYQIENSCIMKKDISELIN